MIKHQSLINKIFALLLFIFLAVRVMGQQRINESVYFTGKVKNKIVSINNFLEYYEVDDDNLNKCSSSSGIFEFHINKKGKVLLKKITGNLPKILVDPIKERINMLNSENNWEFKNSDNKDITFYYPVYMSVNLKDDCKLDFHESFDLLKEIFNEKKLISLQNDKYIIRPSYWAQIR